MNAKRLLTIAVLLVVAMQASFSSAAMASSGKSSEMYFHADPINAHVACWYLEESEYDVDLAIEKLGCDNILFLNLLPEDVKELFLTQMEQVVLEGDFWLVITEPLRREKPQTQASSQEAKQKAPSNSYTGGVEAWRSLVAKYFASGDVDHALAVIDCESIGGNPNAVNPSSGASGLFQHMPRYWAERSANAGFEGASIFDPEANIAVAAWLVYDQGWWHWPNCG